MPNITTPKYHELHIKLTANNKAALDNLLLTIESTHTPDDDLKAWVYPHDNDAELCITQFSDHKIPVYISREV